MAPLDNTLMMVMSVVHIKRKTHTHLQSQIYTHLKDY